MQALLPIALIASIAVITPSSAAPLTAQRLQAYAKCREQLDPLAIRAILEAHERIAKRGYTAGGPSRARVYQFEQMRLPVYGDNLIEWLLDEGDNELRSDPGDPFMKTNPAAMKVESEAGRCGVGSATEYWETTRGIASVLAAARRSRGRALPADEGSSALLGPFLSKLGLCAGSGKVKQTAQGAVICWDGAAIVGQPCPLGINFGSTGYSDRDGVCYNPVGRPSGPRLRTVCSRRGEVRRDVPAYPVVCEEGRWVHAIPCSKDADCGRYALPRSCSRGVCYAHHPDKDRPVTRVFH